MEEKKFPIYRFWGTWNQTNYENNGTGFSDMYKENPTEEELKNKLEEFKKAMEEKQVEKGNPITEWKDVGYKFIEDETWCSGWFGHHTYNQFQDEKETFDSFEEYVDRKRESVEDMDCLMGAEDRWRWNICNCNGCKKRGITTINH